MVKTYMESSLGEEEKKEKIREMLDTGWEIVRSIPNEPVLPVLRQYRIEQYEFSCR